MQINHLGGVDRYSARQLYLAGDEKGCTSFVARSSLSWRGHFRRDRIGCSFQPATSTPETFGANGWSSPP